MDCLVHGVPKSQTRLSNFLFYFHKKNPGVGCHSLLQGNLPDPGIKPTSPSLAGVFFTTGPPGKPLKAFVTVITGRERVLLASSW